MMAYSARVKGVGLFQFVREELAKSDRSDLAS